MNSSTMSTQHDQSNSFDFPPLPFGEFGDDSEFHDENIQLIIPYKKRQFYCVNKELKKDGCSFYTLYVCWRINMEKDVRLI